MGQRWIVAAFMLLMTSNAVAITAHNFLSIADIHFDPFIACYKVSDCTLVPALEHAPVADWPRILQAGDHTLPRYRRDTNYPLLRSFLASAQKTAEKDQVQFVVMLGDWLGHDFKRYYLEYSDDKSASGYQQFVKKTLAFLTQELARTFPGLDVYAVVGNNDTYGRDYSSDPNGAFFRDTSASWATLIKNPQPKKALRSAFPVGGYYAFDLPDQPNVRLIVLNTVLFSYRAMGVDTAVAAEQELNWLHQQLDWARLHQQRVMIAMHIPEGVHFIFNLMQFWQPMYVDRYEAELKEYAPEMMGVLTGHLHANSYHQLSYGQTNTIAETGTISVSPIFGNKPGYRVYQYTTEPFNLHEYETVSLW